MFVPKSSLGKLQIVIRPTPKEPDSGVELENRLLLVHNDRPVNLTVVDFGLDVPANNIGEQIHNSSNTRVATWFAVGFAQKRNCLPLILDSLSEGSMIMFYVLENKVYWNRKGYVTDFNLPFFIEDELLTRHNKLYGGTHFPSSDLPTFERLDWAQIKPTYATKLEI